jgi:outer membrane protein assembly factor BamB
MRRPDTLRRTWAAPLATLLLVVGFLLLPTVGSAATGAGPLPLSSIGGAATTLSASSAYDWAEFHGGPSLDGYTANTTLSASNAGSLGVAWSTNIYGAALDSPVVAYDSTLGETLTYIGTETGNFFAVNVANGQVVWGHWFGAPIRSTPVVQNGSVYVATFSTPAIYRMNASTGGVQCDLISPMPTEGTPLVVTPPGGVRTLYIGTNDAATSEGPLVAMNADTCAKEWEFSGYNQTSGSWDAAAYGVDQAGTPLVIFGSADPDSSIYALNAVTGAEVWRYQSYNPGAYDIGAGPALSLPGTNGFAGGVVYIPSKYGIMYALNFTTGQRIWQTDFNAIAGVTEGGRSSPALVGTNLVFGYNGGMFDLSALNGSVNWQFQDASHTEVLSSPAIAGPAGHELVVAGDLAGRVNVVDLSNGSLLYHYQTGGYITASPALSDGTILIASSDGFLYAFRTGGGNDATLPTTDVTSPGSYVTLSNPSGNLTIRGTASDPVGVGSVTVALQSDQPAGSWWSRTADAWESGPVTSSAHLTAPGASSTNWSLSVPIPLAGGVFQLTANAASVAGPSDIHGPTVDFTVLASTKGAHIKASPADIGPGANVTITGGGFGKSEEVTLSFNGVVLRMTNSSATGSVPSTKVEIPTKTTFGLGAIVAVGAVTNRSAAAAVTVTNNWDQFGFNAGHTGFAPNDPTLFNHVDVGEASWLDLAWHFASGAAFDASPVVANEVAYVADTDGHLYALDIRNGGLLWTWALPSGAAVYVSPVVDTVLGLVFVAASDGSLTAVSVSSGTTVWTTSVSGNLSAPVYADGELYLSSSSGVVAEVSESTGALVWSTTLASPSESTPALDTAQRLLVLGETNGEIVALSNASGKQSWTFAAGGAVDGTVTVAQGSVFAGSTNDQVYCLKETTGKLIWSFTAGGAVTSAGVYLTQGGTGGSEFFVGASNGDVYALQASKGTLKFFLDWKSPVVGLAGIDGVVVGETHAGTIYGMRAYTNLQTWKFSTGDVLASSPVIVDGTVFLTAENGNLYAFTAYGQAPV